MDISHLNSNMIFRSDEEILLTKYLSDRKVPQEYSHNMIVKYDNKKWKIIGACYNGLILHCCNPKFENLKTVIDLSLINDYIKLCK